MFLDFLLIDGHVLGMILMYLPCFVLLLVAMLLVAGSKIYVSSVWYPQIIMVLWHCR